MSANGDVMIGFSGNAFLSFNPGPFLWTKELGTANLDDFLRQQGTTLDQWYSLFGVGSVSNDGTVIAGTGLGMMGYAGWVLKIDTAFVCHPSNAAPGGGAKPRPQTLKVSFPAEFNQHLADGDTAGRCGT